MNNRILIIATLLPVPGILSENRLVSDHIRNHNKIYPGDIFYVFRPTSYLPFQIGSLTGNKEYWKLKDQVRQLSSYELDDLHIEVLPYVSTGSVSAMHSLFSGTVLFMNRKRFKNNFNGLADVVHANNIFPDGLIALQIKRKYKIPYCLTLRDERRMLADPVSRWLAGRILANASYVNTYSYLMKEKAEEMMHINVSLEVPGIGHNFLQQNSVKSSDKKTRFVTAAKLVPVKNIESVIIALSGIEQGKITYTIIGDGPGKELLMELARNCKLDQGTVSFKSSIPNDKLHSELASYDVYIQPSFKETLGLSYFEALACGLPVILTKNTGAYYHIKDKDCYLTVDPYDIEDIRHKILVASDEKWYGSRVMACREAASAARWDLYSERMHNVYVKCIKGERN